MADMVQICANSAVNFHWFFYAVLLFVVTVAAIYVAEIILERREQRKAFLNAQ